MRRKKRRSVLLKCVCYGIFGAGVASLILAAMAIILEGVFTMTIYTGLFGFGISTVHFMLVSAIVIGFIWGLIAQWRRQRIIKRVKIGKRKRYVDAAGNEVEIIDGLKNKLGTPYVVAVDYPDKDSAIVYTQSDFDEIFKEVADGEK